ncbi:TetR/AcrR family transcriptional regulator [Brevibacillus ruminantium]|uniref:TetR/AcrR family transcriptional regulator n=1 Tax=Brevibacillus ruminantium TaxID=2950604 RepID=A0ABY4WD76_9BACL|nr:TetR/AcrR family transcriptional regulator [Brevibacillus ruminantium]USG64801.1 TetR/AcrR family transcriptional regulator [Brevibacillus ruminantium]
MRITKKPEERRNEILDAAELLFTTKGYSSTTVNDILQVVGIAKGTFYYYFQSKEEVMDAIAMRYVSMGVEAAKAIVSDPELNASEKLFHIILAQQPNSERKEQMIEQFHQVNNAEMHQKSLVAAVLQLTPVLTEVIQQGIEEGAFNTPYPKETVEFLLVSSQFLFDEGIFQWQPDELIQKATAFAHIVEKTLGAEPDSFRYLLGTISQSGKSATKEGGESQ